jgi:hypothetical protein
VGVEYGELYDIHDTHNLNEFKDRLGAFRQWMADRGYRHVPLWITEYGTQLPYYDSPYVWDGVAYDEADSRDFMYGSFDFMLTATDPTIGYPPDNDRLVQRWIWYSLDDMDYGGALFDPYNITPFQLGLDWGAYTSGLTPAVDLVAVDISQDSVPLSNGESVTLTLRGRVSNAGNILLTEPAVVRFTDDQGVQIGDATALSDALEGCGHTSEVTVVWTDVAPGSHTVTLEVDFGDQVAEGREDNNVVTSKILVATASVYLPVTSRR